MFATSPIDLQSALRPADNLKKKCISSAHCSTSNFKAAIPLQKELLTICNGQVPMFKNNLLLLVKTSVFEILGLHLDRPFQYVANDLYLNCLFLYKLKDALPKFQRGNDLQKMIHNTIFDQYCIKPSYCFFT